MRRRPLLRAALVGGLAHHAGVVRGQRAAQEEQGRAAAEPQAAPAAPVASSQADDPVARLTQLKSLLDDGALTRAEFDAAKQKVLSGK